MSQFDPNSEPTVERIVVTEPGYTETIVVQRETNTGWWIAGGLAGVIVIAVLWMLANRSDPDTEAKLAQAQADVTAAEANADMAVMQGQMAGAQQSVDMARMDAARAQSDAARATSDARANAARVSSEPTIIITTPSPSPTMTPAPTGGVTVISPASPQP